MSTAFQPVTVRRQRIRRDHVRVRLAVSLALVLALLLAAVFAGGLCPYDPNAQDYSLSLQPPSLAHPFGTDRYGRDLLSRVLIGSRASVFSTLALVALISAAGTLTGVGCGWRGGRVDAVVMRLSDICLAFPGLVLALAIAAVLNGGLHNAVLALAVVSWPKYARIARSQTLALKETDFLSAARLAGGSPLQIIRRHILPNILGPILVTAALDMGTMMMELAGLSFLGLGAMPPTAEWGSMISDGRSMLQTYPWVVLAPGCAMVLSVALFNLLGDAVRDYLDPRSGRGPSAKRERRRRE